MKRMLCLIFLSSFGFGCATPLIIDNGNQRRVFIPCTNDNLCFRDTYNIVWDNWCPNNYRDYPVSYRTKQSEYESSKVEYILLPKSIMTEQVQCGGVR